MQCVSSSLSLSPLESVAGLVLKGTHAQLQVNNPRSVCGNGFPLMSTQCWFKHQATVLALESCLLLLLLLLPLLLLLMPETASEAGLLHTLYSSC